MPENPIRRVGNLKMAEDLLNTGMHIDACDSNGCTMLHYAAQDGNDELVAYLLSRGANRMIRDKWGFTPCGVASIEDWGSYVGKWTKTIEMLRSH